MKKVLFSILCLAMALWGLIGCVTPTKTVTTGEVGIEHETKFNSAYVLLTNDDMTEMGFAFGDSVNVVFSNGVNFEDIPYYNGYYVAKGEPLVCGYPGYPYIVVQENYASNFWGDHNLSESMTVTITLNEKAKYLKQQEAFSLKYSSDRAMYSTDEEFANFREIIAGDIKSGRLYRGASPVDNQYNRANYVDELIEEYNVHFILDLADSEDDIESYKASRDMTNNYALKQEVVLLDMTADYMSETFKEKLGQGLIQMAKADGNYFIHCTEGKDRTGFVCMLLEALCGASYEEMRNDYMITYTNYYGIHSGDSQYEAVNELLFNDFCVNLLGTKDILNGDYVSAAKSYLKSCGMSDDNINELVHRLADNRLY